MHPTSQTASRKPSPLHLHLDFGEAPAQGQQTAFWRRPEPAPPAELGGTTMWSGEWRRPAPPTETPDQSAIRGVKKASARGARPWVLVAIGGTMLAFGFGVGTLIATLGAIFLVLLG